MSYLSEALGKLMTRKGVKNVELARGTGIDQATISRWINGHQTTISDEDLEKVCRFISEDPEEQASLVAARMRDVQNGPGSNLIQLTIGGAALHETPPEYAARKLPPKIEEALANIRRNVQEDDDLRGMVLSLGRMYSPENQARRGK